MILNDMTVESVKTMTIRCCVAYGCQENSLVEKKNKFWGFIEEEVTMYSLGEGVWIYPPV